jgi:hypothetical protein
MRKAEEFIPYFRKEISFEDNRSKAMPRIRKGVVIGIRLNEIEIREGNIMTTWIPINSFNIVWDIQ